MAERRARGTFRASQGDIEALEQALDVWARENNVQDRFFASDSPSLGPVVSWNRSPEGEELADVHPAAGANLVVVKGKVYALGPGGVREAYPARAFTAALEAWRQARVDEVARVLPVIGVPEMVAQFLLR
jgi:hypothetical protein